MDPNARKNPISTEQSRRKFLRTTGTVGAVAATGVAAFGGTASAQPANGVAVEITDINVDEGLITIVVSEVLEEVEVTVTIQDNVVSDVVDISGNNIVVNVGGNVLQNANQVTAVVTGVTQEGERVTGRDTEQL